MVTTTNIASEEIAPQGVIGENRAIEAGNYLIRPPTARASVSLLVQFAPCHASSGDLSERTPKI